MLACCCSQRIGCVVGWSLSVNPPSLSLSAPLCACWGLSEQSHWSWLKAAALLSWSVGARSRMCVWHSVAQQLSQVLILLWATAHRIC